MRAARRDGQPSAPAADHFGPVIDKLPARNKCPDGALVRHNMHDKPGADQLPADGPGRPARRDGEVIGPYANFTARVRFTRKIIAPD